MSSDTPGDGLPDGDDPSLDEALDEALAAYKRGVTGKSAKPEPVPARVGAQLEAIVIQTHCTQCWAYPNGRCGISTDTRLHLGRYERARKNGFITEEEFGLAQARKGESNYVTWEEDP